MAKANTRISIPLWGAIALVGAAGLMLFGRRRSSSVHMDEKIRALKEQFRGLDAVAGSKFETQQSR